MTGGFRRARVFKRRPACVAAFGAVVLASSEKFLGDYYVVPERLNWGAEVNMPARQVSQITGGSLLRSESTGEFCLLGRFDPVLREPPGERLQQQQLKIAGERCPALPLKSAFRKYH